MIDIHEWIARCGRRLNRGVTLKVAAEWLAVWLCIFGTAVLLVKVAWPALWPDVLWLGLTAAPVLAVAVRRASRDRFSATDAAALLDGRLKAGGLLMTIAEKRDGEWQGALPRDEFPWKASLPRIRPVRFARVVALPTLFVGLALLLPVRSTPGNAATNTRRTLPAVEELPELLAALKKDDVLDAAESAYLQEEISKLVESTANSPPTPETWQRIDALRARLNDRLDSEARIIEKGRQAAQRLARAGKNGLPPLTRDQRRQLEQDISAALKRMRNSVKADPKTAKIGTQPETSAKTGIPPKIDGTKTGGNRPGGARTTAKSSGKTPSKLPSHKGVAKSLTAKSAGKTGMKSPAARQPLPDLSKMPDLNTLMKIVEKMPPEVRDRLTREVLKMARSGRFGIPDDPAVRDALLKQVQQMLQRDGRQLQRLQKRFGRVARQFAEPQPQVAPDGKTATGTRTDHPLRHRGKPAVGFRDVVLPPGILNRPRTDPDSVTGRKPTVSPFQPTVGDGGKSTGASSDAKWRALRRKVRPGNRRLVYQYFFNRDEK